jgi:hypothetical protein
VWGVQEGMMMCARASELYSVLIDDGDGFGACMRCLWSKCDETGGVSSLAVLRACKSHELRWNKREI